VSAATLDTDDKNMRPLRVESLRAIPVSPVSRFNVINLLWRTNCESDVCRYEVHRFTSPRGTPDGTSRIAMVEADAVIKGETAYGRTPLDHLAGEYDHMMYLDESVQPSTTYYYRVCAVDAAGQKGEPSDAVAATTTPQTVTSGGTP
jgi:hypothetical protein